MTDVLTANYFCSLIGVSTVETTSIRTSNSLEGEIEEYGQKNVSAVKRNLLNTDEILRIPTNKLLVNLKGNKPLLLDKAIYLDHPLAKKLKDSPISDYNPSWTKNTQNVSIQNKINQVKPQKSETQKIKTLDNF
ncbi:MAG: type IV secretory system conjugative DNA transfer family protein [Clostridia bacterium]|nr:type IV secretory system conjugative DNA transfer family protein [Clostridia bacterium]